MMATRLLLYVISCAAVAMAAPVMTTTMTAVVVAQPSGSAAPPATDTAAPPSLISSTSSSNASSTMPEPSFAFPSDWLNSEHEDAFHAARVAVEESLRHASNGGVPSSPAAKFPEAEDGMEVVVEVEEETAAEQAGPPSPSNPKVVGVIVGASAGGMVVLGAIALFVWQHHRGQSHDDGVVVVHSQASKDPDGLSAPPPHAFPLPLSPVSEAPSSTTTASHEKSRGQDFGHSTLEAFAQAGSDKYSDSNSDSDHAGPCPELVSSSNSAGPNATRLPVKRACPVIIERNHAPSTSSLPSPSALSYPLKKLLHYPRPHTPSSPETASAHTSLHLDRLFALTPEQQRQQQREMVTPFDLPPTEYLPLQNCPFPLVSRQSVMTDPSKRQGIHELPDDDTEQDR